MTQDQFKNYALISVIEILNTNTYEPKEQDFIFKHLINNESVSDDVFVKYLRYSVKGTFFSDPSDIHWLLDFFYCILSDNLSNFEMFLNEKVSYNKSKSFFVDSNKRMLKSVKDYSITFDEKLYLAELKLNDNNLKLLAERYPLLLLKYLKYLSLYDFVLYDRILPYITFEYRYTEFYDKMMVGYYSTFSM